MKCFKKYNKKHFLYLAENNVAKVMKFQLVAYSNIQTRYMIRRQ